MGDRLARYTGCLLGGAVGDALGWPVEFLKWDAIQEKYGAAGITELDTQGNEKAGVSDDTQLTLFTGEGLLRAEARCKARGVCHTPDVIHRAYLRWLLTQGEAANFRDFNKEDRSSGWLVGLPELQNRRAPGNTCISALMANRIGTIEHPLNSSKGCGCMMRVAPVGLMANREGLFSLAAQVAAITHGHPSGYLAAATLAVIVHNVVNGMEIEPAIQDALSELKKHEYHQETAESAERAVEMWRSGQCNQETLAKLGEGWVAEEALAIGIYSALCAEGDFVKGVRLAVNHSGDSDSTGAIAGAILGAHLGSGAIPPEWLEKLELAGTVQEIAIDLCVAYRDDDVWRRKYPGF